MPSCKPFRIFNTWLDKPKVKDLAKEAWAIQLTRNKLYRLLMKLHNVKFNIKKWAIEMGDPRKLT